ncbi:MAG: 3-dehydroquinate synthase [Candidatus Shikimatogenerans sp. JK-2022]|nr:3-dehydroquinate synthase [Candidatus Shikimatogenerans bostrichidophilus]
MIKIKKINFLNKYLKNKKKNKILFFLDKNIKKFCFNYLINKIKIFKKKKIKIIKIPSGEKYKNLKICIKVWKILIKKKFSKKDFLINLGGGVITDLGGFIGNLYKRGLNIINIPTTLLGMVDASIGGKTGINFKNLKNEIGLIKEPKMTLIDINFLKTLSKKEFFSGFGEIIKYGLIYSLKYWNFLKKINFKFFKKKWKKIIYKAIKIKKKIVKKDPEEKLGKRKILNFGHTIGHALESFFLYKKKPITHGKAIVFGILCETWISTKILKFEKKKFKEIYKFILKNYSLKPIKKKYFKIIIYFIKNDKKNYNNEINMVLLKKIGFSTYDNKIKKNLIIKSLKKMNYLLKKNKNEKYKK